jgi:hypothetical protein
MAPTELLARQHAATAARLLEPLGVRLAFLSGNVEDAGASAPSSRRSNPGRWTSSSARRPSSPTTSSTRALG